MFALGLGLALVLAAVFLAVTTPKYTVTSKLLIRGIDRGPDFSASNPAFKDLDIFNATTSIENETEALKSRFLLRQVLTELSLNASYFAEGTWRKEELYGPEVPIRVVVRTLAPAAAKHPIAVHLKDANTFEIEDEEAGRSTHRYGQEVKKPYGRFTVLSAGAAVPASSNRTVLVQLHSLPTLAEDYSHDLTVEPVNKKAAVVEIILLEAVPAKGTAIVNKLIEVYNRENKADRNALAENTIRFIDSRLLALSGELTDVEKKVETFKSQNAVTNVTQEAAIYGEEAKNVNKQLADVTIQLDVLESLQRYLTRPGSKTSLAPSNLGLQDQTLLALLAKFNELQLERDRMLRTTQPDNPLVVNIDEQLSDLRGNILENLRTIKTGLSLTRSTLEARSGQFDANTRQVPTIERKLQSINRQQGVKQGIYLYLLQKREEAALSLAATGSNTRVLDPALISKKPVKPSKPIVYLLAVLAGLLLPLAFVSAKGLLSDAVETRAAVAQRSAVPVAGQVGRLRPGQLLPVAEDAGSPQAEAYHYLRADVLAALAGGPAQVLLLTAGQANEGQTVVALNLAASLGQVGKRVAVVNFNLRTPHLGKYLAANNAAGVSNYLNGPGGPSAPLMNSSSLGPNVQWMDAGPLAPNPTGLMASGRAQELLAGLKPQFDHILVLTAPVGQVADALSLAPLVDACLYVVRLGHARAAHLDVATGLAAGGQFRRVFLVLNDGLA
ncbi:hypothetical protein BEN48_03080 [Hymenobacter glacialis]|uniref:Tyrosine-protein kinase G-rich domain-containing protein n=1 Tax=Hymenobacter glacialis TaxID=1908236 RepID=A0A1G1SYS1_9BACT|nr:hypothetical protein BEN48_03080 [Hymenobacter glacialis]